jgi:hypothetical protein
LVNSAIFQLMPEQVKLTLDIKNKAPIELNDLAESLRALGDEFESFAIEHGQNDSRPGEAKLYVKEVKSGSIIIDLVNYVSPHIVPVMGSAAPVVGVAVAAITQMNTVMEFGEYLKRGFDSLLRRTKGRDDLGKSSLKNYAQILTPVIKDPDSYVHIQTGDINIGNVYLNLDINSAEANRIKRQVDLELDKREQSESATRKKQVLYFYQTRNTIGNRTGDRGKIPTISKKDVKILFADDSLKRQIISGTENIFHWAYVVDVEVTYKEDRAIAYKVIRLHDKFKIDQDEEDLL